MNKLLKDSIATKYHDTLPEFETWSGKEIPNVGDTVKVNFNKLGTGVVDCYFVEYGYLGVVVDLDEAPDWHREQNGNNLALIFGVELGGEL